jgi:hypothetical protein
LLHRVFPIQAQAQPPVSVVTRPCVRCNQALTDPASVEAGIGPICRGFANQILAKETPSAWSDKDLFNFTFLSAESFPVDAQARFAKVFAFVCASHGMNQAEAAKGEDMRATVKELVYLASVAPTNAIYETLIGAIRGIGYIQYAAFVSGDSASGDATLSLENGKVFLAGVRNSVGQNALYKINARREYSPLRWYTSQSNAAEFVRVVSIYWPFVKGAQDVLAALTPAPVLALVPFEAHPETPEEAPQALTEATAPEAAEPAEEAPAEVPTEPAQEAQELSPEPAQAAPTAPAEETPAPSEAEANENQISINHGHFLTHHNVIKRTEKALQVESDCPFSRTITSWIPKSWLEKTSIEGVYNIIPWALDKLTRYQEAALGIREL